MICWVCSGSVIFKVTACQKCVDEKKKSNQIFSDALPLLGFSIIIIHNDNLLALLHSLQITRGIKAAIKCCLTTMSAHK